MYPAPCVGAYHQDGKQSQMGTGEQHENLSQLIKWFFSTTYIVIEPPYFLTLILKDYSQGSTTVNTTSAYSQFTQQCNLL